MPERAFRCFAFLSLALATLIVPSPSRAERVALVIGNSAYVKSPLANPARDADAIAQTLRQIGFDDVALEKDLSADAMRSALRTFARKASGADIAMVYYAGHGTEVAGRNYLIPVDARLERASDLAFEAIDLDSVLEQAEGASKLRLVILDACRNNVFALAGGTRSLSRGLARVEPTGNTLVAYAARAGTVAADGSGTNSPFTTALIKHIATPGLDVSFVFRRVRDDVRKATNGAQEPAIYGTLGGSVIALVEEQPQKAAAPSVAAAETPTAPERPAAKNDPAASVAAQVLALITGNGDPELAKPDKQAPPRPTESASQPSPKTAATKSEPAGPKVAMVRIPEKPGPVIEETVSAVGPGAHRADVKVIATEKSPGIEFAVAYSPDGTKLATGSDEGLVRLWDAATGKAIAKLPGHAGYVVDVAFSPDGKLLASASADKSVILWDLASSAVKKKIEYRERADAVAFSPDGTILATHDDDVIQLYDVATGALKSSLERRVYNIRSLFFAPDGKRIAALCDGVTLWDLGYVLGYGNKLQTFSSNVGGYASEAAFAPDWKRAAVAHENLLRVYTVTKFGGEPERVLKHAEAKQGIEDDIDDVVFSPDGSRVITINDETIKIWDAASGKLRLTIDSPVSTPTSLAVSPDGSTLAITGNKLRIVPIGRALTASTAH